MKTPEDKDWPDPPETNVVDERAELDAIHAIRPIKPLYAIWILQDFVIYSRLPRPNAWRRFWTWAFFGWRWTKVKK